MGVEGAKQVGKTALERPRQLRWYTLFRVWRVKGGWNVLEREY